MEQSNNKRKRLLFITHSSASTGGAEDDFERLLKYFSGLNKYHIIGLFPEGERASSYCEFCDEYFYYNQGWFPVLKGRIRDYLRYLKIGLKQYYQIKGLIKTFKTDCAIINVSVLLLPTILLYRLGIKNIVFIRETIYPDKLRSIYFRFLSRYICYAIGVSQLLTDNYLRSTNRKNAFTLYSSIESDFKHFDKIDLSKAINNDFINDYVYDDNFFKILCNGTVTKRKNQILALKAINHLVNDLKHNNIIIIFLGFYAVNDSYFLELNEYINENNLINNSCFIGEKDKNFVYNLYELMDVSLLTSLSEGFPLVVAETLAFGKPLISVLVGGIPEVIKNGENGLLVNYDENEIAEAIIKLKSDRMLYEKLSRNGIKTFNETFNLEKNLTKIKQIIDNL